MATQIAGGEDQVWDQPVLRIEINDQPPQEDNPGQEKIRQTPPPQPERGITVIPFGNPEEELGKVVIPQQTESAYGSLTYFLE